MVQPRVKAAIGMGAALWHRIAGAKHTIGRSVSPQNRGLARRLADVLGAVFELGNGLYVMYVVPIFDIVNNIICHHADLLV